MKNNKNEPAIPLPRRAQSTFRVGVDRSGYWVALDQDGRCGGLFVGRNEAIRFALSQNGNRREQVLMIESSLDLDFEPGQTWPAQASIDQGDLDVSARYGES